MIAELARRVRWVSSDPAVVAEAATDLGRMITRVPRAVVRPTTADEVVATLQLAARHGVKVVARGRGHGTSGLAQAAGGIVLDLRGMAETRWIAGGVCAGAGATWRAALATALERGRTFPVLVDYLELTVGGTLALGGVAESSFARGLATDHLLALEVVTGAGEHVRCSATERPELFDACRGGLGQCAVILAAELAVCAAPAGLTVRTEPVASARALLDEVGRAAADHVRGTVDCDRRGRRRFAVTRAREDGGPTTVLDHARRLDGFERDMRALGVWDVPHPWAFLVVGASRAEALLEAAMARLREPRDGRILVYALRRARVATPLVALPDEEELFLLGILCNAVNRAPAELVAESVALARGARVYPAGSVPVALGPALLAAKRRFDPAGVLGAELA